jgi:hypothetical protein
VLRGLGAGPASPQHAGIDGQAPKLLYVGKAAGGLRRRLRRHVDGTLPGLANPLAAQGTVLFPFGDWYRPDLVGRMAHATDLLEVARQQRHLWQQLNLAWTWTTCDRAAAAALEREAIRAYSPLLNTTFAPTGPVELRASNGAEQARARWLWHASWAAIHVPSYPFRTVKAEELWAEATVDAQGFPVPFMDDVPDRGDARQRVPRARHLLELLHEAAREAAPEIRDAVGLTRGRGELEVWWAVHAGAPYLVKASTVIEATAASLRQESPGRAPCPANLPEPSRRSELLELVRTLSGRSRKYDHVLAVRF